MSNEQCPIITPKIDRNGCSVYSLEQIQSKYREVKQLNHIHWLAYWWDSNEKKEESWLHWSFLQFVSSDLDDTETMVAIICHGQGHAGLRELRHSYWGEADKGGYVFYPPFKSMLLLIEDLEKYFDLD